MNSAVVDGSVGAGAGDVAGVCAAAAVPCLHVADVGAAVELPPAVAAVDDTAAAVDIDADQISSLCCPHTP